MTKKEKELREIVREEISRDRKRAEDLAFNADIQRLHEIVCAVYRAIGPTLPDDGPLAVATRQELHAVADRIHRERPMDRMILTNELEGLFGE